MTGGNFRKLLALVATLMLAACGGGGGSDQGGSTPPTSPPPAQSTIPGYDLQGTIAALRQHSPMPVFPITPPPFVDPLLNAEGVILDKRTGRTNPTLAGRFAIDRFHIYREAPANEAGDYFDQAKTQTDFLAANIDCKNAVGLWRHDFSASFGVEPGWGSAFTNAHGVVALLIMSKALGNPQRYLDPAFCAINAFDVDVLDGGFRTPVGAGYWFEEYPVPSRPGVLNGHIFALAGLHYSCTYAKIQKACMLFEKGAEAVRIRLPEYDAGIISRYSLVEGNYAGPGYNELVAQLLEWLYSVKPDPVFKTYMDRFYDYLPEEFDITVSTAPSPANGPDRLTDGSLWNGYWSTYRFPATLQFDQGSDKPIRAIAISYVGDNAGMFEYAIINDDGSEGPYVPAPPPQITARHLIEGNQKSTVGVYDLNITARRLRIRFTAPTVADVVALREVNVLH